MEKERDPDNVDGETTKGLAGSQWLAWGLKWSGSAIWMFTIGISFYYYVRVYIAYRNASETGKYSAFNSAAYSVLSGIALSCILSIFGETTLIGLLCFRTLQWLCLLI